MRKFLMCALFAVSGSVSAQQAADTVAPEAAGTGTFLSLSPEIDAALAAKAAGRPVEAQNWMVAAANPLAVQAGADVLAAGGTAADALVAVQVMLGLVEPQSSGLGGGAFLVWYDAVTGALTTIDGRETTPLAATPTLFQDADGEPLKFYDAVVGGRSVGTPGTPALLAEVHKRWGRADWADLLAPAIDLAQSGFAVSPRLAGLVSSDAERLARSQITADYFLPGGTPVRAGDTLVNRPYADTLKTLASDGVGAFYAGELAKTMVATVTGAKGNPEIGRAHV